jgi:hypothetical protein
MPVTKPLGMVLIILLVGLGILCLSSRLPRYLAEEQKQTRYRKNRER